MITTVTLNPAIDKTINIEDFSIGSVNRVSAIRTDAGGKGINVSKVIKSLGGSSRAVAILAGNCGNFIKEYLDRASIENDCLFIEGETRTNIKVVDKINHTNTDINEAGPFVSMENLNEVFEKLCCGMKQEDLLVLSGSIPKSAEKDIYRQWIEKTKEKGIKTILDADGELLRQGIEAGPHLIKPNIHELEALFNQRIDSIDEVINVSKEFFKKGIEIVVVSLGENGALFMKKDTAIRAKGIKVEVESTVGAGDSMVAALAFALERSYDFEKAVRLSVACGTASVMTEGTQAPDFDVVMDLESKVEIEYITNNLVEV